MSSTWWGLASGLIGLAGYAWYIPRTLWGPTRPDRAAWLVFTAEYGVLIAAQAAAGAGAALWLPALQAAGTTIVCVLAFRKTARTARQRRSERRAAARALWGRVGWPDTAAGAGAAAALALWPVTSSPALATVCVVAAEGYGMTRTVVKVWRCPASEPPVFWMLCVVGGLCAVQAAGPHPAAAVRIYLGFFVAMGASVVAAGHLGSRRPHPHAPGRNPPAPRLTDAQRSAPTPPPQCRGRPLPP